MLIISSGSLYNYGLNRFFALAKKAGFESVEIMISDVWDTREANYLEKLEKESNLEIKALHSPFVEVKAWPKAQDKFFNFLKLAEGLKAENLIVHPYDDDFLKWLGQNLNQIQQKTKVKICVENLPKKYNEKGKIIYSGLNPTKLLNFEHLCLDTTHLATLGLDLLAVYQKIKDKLAHIHLSDALYFRPLDPEEEDEHLFPGEGKLPLVAFLKQLKKDKYKGIISLELRPEYLGEGDEKKIVQRMKEAKSFVERYFR